MSALPDIRIDDFDVSVGVHALPRSTPFKRVVDIVVGRCITGAARRTTSRRRGTGFKSAGLVSGTKRSWTRGSRAWAST